MSKRYQAAILTASYNGLKVPNAPTIGTATSGGLSASVTFTAPSNVGGGAITSYTVISSPGSITGVGASSPVTVSGLTSGVSYTFTVVANNVYGSGPASAASNSITAVDPSAFIENLFSTYLYTGTSATQVIPNGIDLAGKGGMVWTKSRSTGGTDPVIYDTSRGPGYFVKTDQTAAQIYASNSLTSFDSTGMTFGPDTSQGYSNYAPYGNYVAWTFRKQPKFFDVVTYTGTGSARTVAHNLGSVPGCIMVKCTNSAEEWQVYHTSLGNTQYLQLDSFNEARTGGTRWNNTSPTSTEFTVGTNSATNGSGLTFVAYLFAHNAGGFGLTGTDNVISCGSFTADGSGAATVNLGYEPQFVLWKASSTTSSWNIHDTMRGMPVSGSVSRLFANLSSAEDSSTNNITNVSNTGFSFTGSGYAGANVIYIAIRRGPMKVPTSGTSVFTPTTVSVSSTPSFTSNSVPDLVTVGYRPGTASDYPTWSSRLTGNTFLTSSSTAAENSSYPNIWTFNGQKTFGSTFVNSVAWMFSRAPSFFDEVCYTGDSTTPRNITHNLGVAPELILVKSRSNTRGWAVYSSAIGAGKYLILNGTYAALTDTTIWANTSPTSSVFTVGNPFDVNNSGYTYVAYLFATCSGVSKVGSYTGTGATQTISCGFSGGARFVLIKRTDTTGDWYVWDTARGMVSGTDPSLLLNDTAAEVNANSIYTTTGGFQIVSTAAGINASGGTYIYLAIA